MSDKKPLLKTQDELRKILSEEAYNVTQNSATERPHSHKYNLEQSLGTYNCVCCDKALFLSDTKFDAGCGWPSFFATVSDNAVKEVEDLSYQSRPRTEIRCNGCDAHLGHVFPDGPPPTGLRYCLNGSALNFTKNN